MFNIRYKKNLIAYEISLSEAGTIYSGVNDNIQSGTLLHWPTFKSITVVTIAPRLLLKVTLMLLHRGIKRTGISDGRGNLPTLILWDLSLLY
jgi:hypothetical protein